MQLLAFFIESKEGHTMIRAQTLTSNGWINTYYIIDTGAAKSLFSPEVSKVKGFCDYITDLNGVTLMSQRCTAVLSLAEHIMTVDGNVIDYDILPSVAGKHLSGILGVDFFEKYHIILDFSNGGIYLRESWEKETNEYPFIPMNLESYHIPMILLNFQNHKLPFVVDTGATNNMMVPAITYNSKEMMNRDSYVIKGLISSCFAKECEVDFYIQMYREGKIVRYDFFDIFAFIERDTIVRSSIFNTIYGLIGNDFIHRQKWIIDFAERKIYINVEWSC